MNKKRLVGLLRKPSVAFSSPLERNWLVTKDWDVKVKSERDRKYEIWKILNALKRPFRKQIFVFMITFKGNLERQCY